MIEKLTFVCSEYFGWGGTYGGFGSLTRILAENLVKRGIDVHVLTPKRKKASAATQMDDYGEINGVKIHSFNSRIKWRLGFKMKEFPELPESQIFHSQAIDFWGYFFRKQTPDAIHLVTAQDPRPIDELKESYFPYYPDMATLKWRLKFEIKQRMCKEFCKNVDMVYVQAKYISNKVKTMFGLDYLPKFLPNPVSIPEGKIEKNDCPTVLFLGRWDPIKRPDIMLEVAKRLPNVQFICCGVANERFKDYFAPLLKKARQLKNVHYMGYVQSEVKANLLSKSWILLNTSMRECLPVSFLEAGAYNQAIVSPNDPDDFASNFGYKIQDKENIDEYVAAIKSLLVNDGWKEKGNLAKKYVQENHELKCVIDRHLGVYDSWV